eukprot:2295897-Amphidinium_carterae.2
MTVTSDRNNLVTMISVLAVNTLCEALERNPERVWATVAHGCVFLSSLTRGVDCIDLARPAQESVYCRASDGNRVHCSTCGSDHAMRSVVI